MSTAPGIPELPLAAHPDIDSMLSRKFGKEVANYFSGSPLNRVSFLRTDHKFISAACTHPSTEFLLCNDLASVAKDPSHVHYVKHEVIKSLVGSNPFEKEEEDMVKLFRSDVTVPLVLFFWE
jgi:NAD+ diphosphatase